MPTVFRASGRRQTRLGDPPQVALASGPPPQVFRAGRQRRTALWSPSTWPTGTPPPPPPPIPGFAPAPQFTRPTTVAGKTARAWTNQRWRTTQPPPVIASRWFGRGWFGSTWFGPHWWGVALGSPIPPVLYLPPRLLVRQAPLEASRRRAPQPLLFTVPAVLIPNADLLAAIQVWWNGPSGLRTTIGPLFTDIAQAGQVVPFVLLTVPDEGGHGLSLEDKQVEIWFSAFANDLVTARVYGNLIKTAIDPSKSGRPRWSWQAGNEFGTFPENKGTKEKVAGTDKNGKPVWCWHMPFTSFITGDV